jgi:2-oxoisovalerate dehydrogenase E2 component (dihydrolipoyl transacylase)
MTPSTHVIKMPDIGEGIVEVELVAWRVAAGDVVKEDQIVADVMTDKATVEIPSPVHGVVHSLGAEAGTVMRVGSALITIALESSAAATGAAAGSAEVPVAAAGAVAPPSPAPAPTPLGQLGQAAQLAGAALPTEPAAVLSPLATVLPPIATAPGATAATGTAVLAASAGQLPAARPIASPSVRRRAWELGVDLAQVRPSGPAGRILHADLQAQAEALKSAGAASPDWAVGGGSPSADRPLQASVAPAPAVTQASLQGNAAAAQHVGKPSDRHWVQARGDGIEAVKIMGLRRKIAQKMQESKRNIPHFSYVEECDVTELEALRERLNAQHGASRGKLTVLPLLVRAVCRALRDFPQINARFDEEAGVVNRFEAVHLGVAAQTPSGLMVPVLRHAEALDLWRCASEIRRLAEAARSGRATREELSGSTFTISSLGPLGGIVTTPVINHPEVGILGVNRIVERPMMRGGQVVGRLMMNLSSSFDHRVVDGQDAAEFIQAVRALLETPATLFID